MNIGSMMGGAPSAAMMEKMQQKMFAKVDANKNGGIDKSEMTQFAQDNGLDTSKVDEMFKTADADGSGEIDSKENAAMMDKIAEKMKSAFGQSSVSATGSSSDSDDVLMQMMDKIREHSQEPQAGGNVLQQFLSQLQQQNNSYNQNGSKESSSVPSFFSAAA